MLTNKKASSIAIDILLNNTRIKGLIEGIYDRRYITYAFSDKSKYRVRAFLNTLLLYAEKKIESAEFLWLKKSNSKGKPASMFSETIAFIDSDEARKILTELLVYFESGKEAPLKFSPSSAEKVLNHEKVENIFLDEAEGISYASIPPDYSIKNLYDNDYFLEFEIENFSKRDFDIMVYEEDRFKQIKSIAGLLNLKSI